MQQDIQTITIYYEIVYGIVAAAVIGYAVWLGRAAKRARARLEAGK